MPTMRIARGLFLGAAFGEEIFGNPHAAFYLLIASVICGYMFCEIRTEAKDGE